MQNERLAAKERGDVTYPGAQCKWGHDGERYVSSGACVQCVRDRAAQASEGKRGIMSGREVAQLLLKGGPMTAQGAAAAGLEWFNRVNRCGHDIVKLDGATCHLCEDVDPKLQLDLAHPLLN